MLTDTSGPRANASPRRTVERSSTANLYFGALRATGYKWLDLAEFCRRLLPEGEALAKIRYFTARISPRENDRNGPQRQQVYLRALSTLEPLMSIHFGKFQSTQVRAHLVTPLRDGTRYVLVHKTVEKGSDVNLAAYLLRDAFKGVCDTAVIVSNDSDLAEPLRMAREECGVRIGVINPHYPRRPSHLLSQHADFIKPVHRRHLGKLAIPGGDGRRPRLLQETAGLVNTEARQWRASFPAGRSPAGGSPKDSHRLQEPSSSFHNRSPAAP